MLPHRRDLVDEGLPAYLYRALCLQESTVLPSLTEVSVARMYPCIPLLHLIAVLLGYISYRKQSNSWVYKNYVKGEADQDRLYIHMYLQESKHL